MHKIKENNNVKYRDIKLKNRIQNALQPLIIQDGYIDMYQVDTRTRDIGQNKRYFSMINRSTS